MSLGANDCLQMTQKSRGPDRLVLGGMPVPGTIDTSTQRFLTVVTDERRGSFEWSDSAEYGTRFIPRREGIYSIVFFGYAGSGPVVYLTKNAQPAVLVTGGLGAYTNLPHSAKFSLLNGALVQAAAYSLQQSVTTYLVPGDIIRVLASNNCSTDTVFFSMEYLGNP